MIQLKTEKILAEVEGGIGWLTFNHPQRRNAVSLEMWQGIGDALEAFQQDDTRASGRHERRRRQGVRGRRGHFRVRSASGERAAAQGIWRNLRARPPLAARIWTSR